MSSCVIVCHESCHISHADVKPCTKACLAWNVSIVSKIVPLLQEEEEMATQQQQEAEDDLAVRNRKGAGHEATISGDIG